jgi:hypothetical protein
MEAAQPVSPGGSVFYFDVRGALAAAAADQIDEWVNAFLTGGADGRGTNLPMALGLRKQRRWWIGPMRVRIRTLTRICGPEPEMEYRTTREGFEAKVSAIAGRDPESLPPIILEYQGATLGLHDGSHRHEAMRRRGAEFIWALVWCNSEPDYRAAVDAFARSDSDDIQLG